MNYDTSYEDKLYNELIKKEENPDIAFRRVGVNAGTITRDIVDSSIQSHYFIKFTNNKGLNDNIKIIKLNKIIKLAFSASDVLIQI